MIPGLKKIDPIRACHINEAMFLSQTARPRTRGQVFEGFTVYPLGPLSASSRPVQRPEQTLSLLWRLKKMGRPSETREFLRRNERNIFDHPPTDNDNLLIRCYIVAEP